RRVRLAASRQASAGRGPLESRGEDRAEVFGFPHDELHPQLRALRDRDFPPLPGTHRLSRVSFEAVGVQAVERIFWVLLGPYDQGHRTDAGPLGEGQLQGDVDVLRVPALKDDLGLSGQAVQLPDGAAVVFRYRLGQVAAAAEGVASLRRVPAHVEP